MTAIVTIGIELSARTQVGLLARRDHDAGGCSRSSRWSRSTAADVPTEIDSRRSRGSTRSTSSRTTVADRRRAARALHLLGVGQRRDGQRGDGGLARSPWPLGGHLDADPARRSTSSSPTRRWPTRGTDFLRHNREDVLSGLGSDVFGSPLDKILIIAVLTSAAASTQTTILPTARTTLSMAAERAIPTIFGRVHPRFQTPAISTIVMGALSVAWYVGLTILSEDILFDSLAALGLMIAFYYGLTGFACAIYYRRELFTSAKNFFAAGVLPVLGGLALTYVFVKSASDLADPGKRDDLRPRPAARDRDLLRGPGPGADGRAMDPLAGVLPHRPEIALPREPGRGAAAAARRHNRVATMCRCDVDPRRTRVTRWPGEIDPRLRHGHRSAPRRAARCSPASWRSDGVRHRSSSRYGYEPQPAVGDRPADRDALTAARPRTRPRRRWSARVASVRTPEPALIARRPARGLAELAARAPARARSSSAATSEPPLRRASPRLDPAQAALPLRRAREPSSGPSAVLA